MKENELIVELSTRLKWDKQNTEKVLAAFGEVVQDRLANNDVISFHGLGQFEAKKKSERMSVNPTNSKRYLVPPKLVPVFKPVATLKSYLKTLDSNG